MNRSQKSHTDAIKAINNTKWLRSPGAAVDVWDVVPSGVLEVAGTQLREARPPFVVRHWQVLELKDQEGPAYPYAAHVDAHIALEVGHTTPARHVLGHVPSTASL